MILKPTQPIGTSTTPMHPKGASAIAADSAHPQSVHVLVIFSTHRHSTSDAKLPVIDFAGIGSTQEYLVRNVTRRIDNVTIC